MTGYANPERPAGRGSDGRTDGNRFVFSSRTVDHVVYKTPVESSLARVWADILRISSIPREKDFLALGGDSVTALRVINRIRREFNVNVTVREFFENSTIAGLAAILDQLR
jgi:hypothetical protein